MGAHGLDCCSFRWLSLSLSKVNDNEAEEPGGVHWSFMVHSKLDDAFFSFDSIERLNTLPTFKQGSAGTKRTYMLETAQTRWLHLGNRSSGQHNQRHLFYIKYVYRMKCSKYSAIVLRPSKLYLYFDNFHSLNELCNSNYKYIYVKTKKIIK